MRHYHLEANWKVMLNNDEIIYQDDFAGYELNAWKRLQIYCKEKGVYPIHMTLEFGDNQLNVLEPYQHGYFFKRGILSEFLCEANGDGSTTSFQGNRAKTFIIGQYSPDYGIKAFTVKIPELGVWDYGYRKVEELYLKEQSLFLVKSCQNIPANIQTEK